uniref:Transposase Tc1-like domain-containing protein n=1 Tax=Stegastes partitus TaxID=144197 RepID=A0A3B5B5P7_9TELE
MDEQRHLAIARLQVGGRQLDVARELGVSQSVISRLASRHRTTGTVRDRPRSVAPRVTDRNDDQYLRTYALRQCYASATELQARLRDVRGTRVSRQTIGNRLHRFGLNARRLLQVTPLTPRHRRERLQWAQDHVTWTMQQWSTVLFTDERRVTLQMMVVSVAGEGEVSDMLRLTWSPGFTLVEEVQQSGQASPASAKQMTWQSCV